MLQKEDVDGWNKVFADCQIKQSDLTKPSEGFLVKALVCYTRRFGYKVETPFPLDGNNVDNNRDNRLFMIRLTRKIDHFLKITDKSFVFTYYDLIRPTPKKTSHTLYILLNYLFYYNMYKEDVFKMPLERIQKYHEIKSLIDCQKRENETIIREAQELKLELDELMKELPIARSQHKELSEKVISKEEALKKLQETCNELEEKLKHARDQKRGLLKRVVADEESQELQKQIENLRADFAKHKELETTSENSLRELSDNLAQMQQLKTEILNAGDIVHKRLIEQLRETKKQLEQAMKDEHIAEERLTLLLQQIEEETQLQRSIDEQCHARKQEYELKIKYFRTTLEKLQNILNTKKNAASQMEIEEHALHCQIEEQIDIGVYLKENIAEILVQYENNVKQL